MNRIIDGNRVLTLIEKLKMKHIAFVPKGAVDSRFFLLKGGDKMEKEKFIEILKKNGVEISKNQEEEKKKEENEEAVLISKEDLVSALTEGINTAVSQMKEEQETLKKSQEEIKDNVSTVQEAVSKIDVSSVQKSQESLGERIEKLENATAGSQQDGEEEEEVEKKEEKPIWENVLPINFESMNE